MLSSRSGRYQTDASGTPVGGIAVKVVWFDSAASNMKAHQASQRGGAIGLNLRDDGRIELMGKARIALDGEFRLPG